jgi:hypothetical protein
VVFLNIINRNLDIFARLKILPLRPSQNIFFSHSVRVEICVTTTSEGLIELVTASYTKSLGFHSE